MQVGAPSIIDISKCSFFELLKSSSLKVLAPSCVCSIVCPCVLLGNMKASVCDEEKVKPSLNPCLGRCGEGEFECLQVALMTALFWPCPLLLSFHLFHVRRSIRVNYRVAESNNTIADFFDALCCWPCVLLQVTRFVDSHKKAGTMRFDWEGQTVLDEMLPKPRDVTRRVAILGPRGCGKSCLSRKLVGALPTDQARECQIQAGMKAISVSDSSIEWLEVWEIPYNLVSSAQSHRVLSLADAAVLVFDSSDDSGDSLRQLMDLCASVEEYLVGKKLVCLANKIDLFHSFPQTPPDRQLSWTAQEKADIVLRRQSQLEEAEKWTTRNSILFLQASAVENKNVLAARGFLLGSQGFEKTAIV